MSDTSEDAPARRSGGKFQIVPAVVWAYAGVVRRSAFALRVLALPIALDLLAVVVGWMTGELLLKGAVTLLAGLAMLPAAVFWHRYAAFGDPSSPPPIIPRMGPREWRYLLDLVVVFGVLIPFALVLVAIVVVFSQFQSIDIDFRGMAPNLSTLADFVFQVGLSALFAYLLARILLILPATALDRRIGLGEAFRRSRPLALRLAVALWLAFLPVDLAELLASLSTGLSVNGMDMVLIGRLGGPTLAVVLFRSLIAVASCVQALASAAILTRTFMAATGFQPADANAASSPH